MPAKSAHTPYLPDRAAIRSFLDLAVYRDVEKEHLAVYFGWFFVVGV
ncbi:MAG: hypothetical protein ACREDT_13165 [Methylocella sp.]